MKSRKPRPASFEQPRDGKRNPRAKARTVARKQQRDRKRAMRESR